MLDSTTHLFAMRPNQDGCCQLAIHAVQGRTTALVGRMIKRSRYSRSAVGWPINFRRTDTPRSSRVMGRRLALWKAFHNGRAAARCRPALSIRRFPPGGAGGDKARLSPQSLNRRPGRTDSVHLNVSRECRLSPKSSDLLIALSALLHDALRARMRHYLQSIVVRKFRDRSLLISFGVRKKAAFRSVRHATAS